MARLRDVAAIRNLKDAMDGVLAQFSIATEKEGEPVRSDRIYLVWQFLALASEDSFIGERRRGERDSRETITDAVCEFLSPEDVSFDPATSPAYPGYDLYRVTVRVPAAPIG